ncbi:EAL domain-containing protein [Amphibacillus cookii]|uniref:EAL domain-containing protein n=1 Tax=Amphibacillus cookii TaxID=767787 RepID=UPI00195851EF|nr:EAL domain-containing protein [Amphibacillus cookii]MBM7540328.1 EAL domain-containing protein (putative c-di-GMP-specific phosphodiesterase class I) [Amphibacillus cookii]
MDSMELMDKLNDIVPAYQPFVSAVTHEIAGYELFARRVEGNRLISLASFFNDEEVPAEYKLEVNQHVLTQALSQLSHYPSLFLMINWTAEEWLIDDGEPLLERLNAFDEAGFPLQRIIVQIKEQDLDIYYDQLYHLLLYYKSCGIQIAIDQLGARTANLDRIRQLEPNVLKMNTRIIGSYDSKGYDDIIYSFEQLAERIGAALLFDNIEDDFLHYYAWKHGGRYYQGFYLSDIHSGNLDHSTIAVDISQKTASFVKRQKQLVETRLNWILDWEKQLIELVNVWWQLNEVNPFLEKVGEVFHNESFRIYICDSNGEQISANYHKRSNQWFFESDYIGANWAFRPYYLTNMMHMRLWNRAMLSEIYADIETRERIRTLSFPLSKDYFIFIDIAYRFIYKNDCFLI